MLQLLNYYFVGCDTGKYMHVITCPCYFELNTEIHFCMLFFFIGCFRFCGQLLEIGWCVHFETGRQEYEWCSRWGGRWNTWFDLYVSPYPLKSGAYQIMIITTDLVTKKPNLPLRGHKKIWNEVNFLNRGWKMQMQPHVSPDFNHQPKVSFGSGVITTPLPCVCWA